MVLLVIGLERELRAPDSQRTNVPLICQWAVMGIIQGWHSPLPAVLLLACLGKDKCSLYP